MKNVNYLVRALLLVAQFLITAESGCAPPGPEEQCRYTNGTILRYDGAAWSTQASVTQCVLLGVWGSAGNNVWAVGMAGTLLKYDGTSWLPKSSGTTYALRDVWGSDANNVWAAGLSGQIPKGD